MENKLNYRDMVIYNDGELKDRVEYLKGKVESLKSNAIKANYLSKLSKAHQST